MGKRTDKEAKKLRAQVAKQARLIENLGKRLGWLELGVSHAGGQLDLASEKCRGLRFDYQHETQVER